MNKQELIKKIRNSIEQEQKKYDEIPESNVFDRAYSLGRINGLLRAWEIAQSMED